MGRMKFFIDANVLISGMVFRGNEYRLLLNIIPGKSIHLFVTSGHVIDEIIRVMVAKFPKHLNLAKEFFSCLEIKVVPTDNYIDEMEKIDEIRDKNDKHVLASAYSAKCDIIVTGDKDLLSLKKYQKIQILTAKQALTDFFD